MDASATGEKRFHLEKCRKVQRSDVLHVHVHVVVVVYMMYMNMNMNMNMNMST